MDRRGKNSRRVALPDDEEYDPEPQRSAPRAAEPSYDRSTLPQQHAGGGARAAAGTRPAAAAAGSPVMTVKRTSSTKPPRTGGASTSRRTAAAAAAGVADSDVVVIPAQARSSPPPLVVTAAPAAADKGVVVIPPSPATTDASVASTTPVVPPPGVGDLADGSSGAAVADAPAPRGTKSARKLQRVYARPTRGKSLYVQISEALVVLTYLAVVAISIAMLYTLFTENSADLHEMAFSIAGIFVCVGRRLVAGGRGWAGGLVCAVRVGWRRRSVLQKDPCELEMHRSRSRVPTPVCFSRAYSACSALTLPLSFHDVHMHCAHYVSPLQVRVPTATQRGGGASFYGRAAPRLHREEAGATISRAAAPLATAVIHRQRCAHNNAPAHPPSRAQKYYVRILFMVPIYSCVLPLLGCWDGWGGRAL
jgi:hypothetical protein